MNLILKTILTPARYSYRSLLYIKKRSKTIFQKSEDSYKIHNSQYIDPTALENHKKTFKEFENQDLFNHPENKIEQLLLEHPNVRETAVDIGCGAGWMSAKLSETFKNVIAIEPSDAAIEIGKHIFSDKKYSNIQWIVGFAEKELQKYQLEQPVFFVTGCVLSHIIDKTVKDICAAVNNIAQKGSILSFAECWGKESHDFMWHIRTKEWWQQQLSDWKLDFHGPTIQNLSDRHKGFHGIKIK
jgi:SAM-dependent methyltransferase